MMARAIVFEQESQMPQKNHSMRHILILGAAILHKIYRNTVSWTYKIASIVVVVIHYRTSFSWLWKPLDIYIYLISRSQRFCISFY